MNFLPIVTRELTVQARRPASHRMRVGGAMVATWLVLLLMATTDLSSGGAVFFQALAGLAFLYCAFEGLRQTADSLSGEKRAGTLGLLVLTDLHGYDIVLGKLAATSLNSFYALLGLLPPLAIPLVLGGVTGGEFWRVALVLLVTLGLSVTSGLCVSALVHSEVAAWTGSVLLTGAVLVGPGLAFMGAFDTAYRAAPQGYWRPLAPCVAVGVVELAAACWALPRKWHETGPSPKPAWWAKLGSRLGLGRRRYPAPVRAVMLDRNPALWLASRRQPYAAVWLVVGLAALGGLALVASQQKWIATAWGFGAVIGLHLCLAAWIGWLACRTGAELRQSGLLELVLTSPLTVPQLLDGYLYAMQRLLLGPMLALVGAEWVLAAWVGLAQNLDPFGPTILMVFVGAQAVVDWVATSTYGFWSGLRLGRLAPAWGRTVGLVLALPTLLGAVLPCLVPFVLLTKLLLFVTQPRTHMLLRLRNVAAGEVEVRRPRVFRGAARSAQLPDVLDR